MAIWCLISISFANAITIEMIRRLCDRVKTIRAGDIAERADNELAEFGIVREVGL